jgi:hypothetical protein
MRFYTAGVRDGEVRVGAWELDELRVTDVSSVSTRESALFAFTTLLDAALDAEDEPTIVLALSIRDESQS